MKRKIKGIHIIIALLTLICATSIFLGVKSLYALQEKILELDKTIYRLEDEYYKNQEFTNRINDMTKSSFIDDIDYIPKGFDKNEDTVDLQVTIYPKDVESFTAESATVNGVTYELMEDSASLSPCFEMTVEKRTYVGEIEVEMTIAGKTHKETLYPWQLGLSDMPYEHYFKHKIFVRSHAIEKRSLLDMHHITKNTFTKDSYMVIDTDEWSGKAPILHFGKPGAEKTFELIPDEENNSNGASMEFVFPKDFSPAASEKLYVTYETKSGCYVKWTMDFCEDSLYWYADPNEETCLYDWERGY